MTNDVNSMPWSESIVTTSECRSDQPELDPMSSFLLNKFVSSHCGCHYCSVTFPTSQPTRVTDTDAETEESTAAGTHELRWLTSDEEEIISTQGSFGPYVWFKIIQNNMEDLSTSTSYFETGTGNYTLFFCIKHIDTRSATCEPVVICTPSPSCLLAKKKDTRIASEAPIVTHKSANKASGDLKSLWGLLFLPGFFVGICSAYGVYQHRIKSSLKETTKAHVIE